MDDFTRPAEPVNGSHEMPVIVIIEDRMLARTCIANILRKELAGFEIVEMVTTGDLNGLSGRNVRLVAFNIEDKRITDTSVVDRLALIERSCPNARVALLSNRDDEDTASAAIQRGVHGFFPTTIPVEIAIAGLRLVLAGAVYRPLPITRPEGPNHKATSEHTGAPKLSGVNEDNTIARITPDRAAMTCLTPREQHVLAALKLGLPNKLIAVRLNLSENTVKMHIQRIMRKCCARNRTEAVLRWSADDYARALPALSTS